MEISDKEYIAMLESSLPASEYIYVTGDSTDMEAQAAPNTDPHAKTPECDPKGANPDALTLQGGGEATPNSDGQETPYIGKETIKDEEANKVAMWDGVGQFPSTFSDPLLSKIIDKFTNTNIINRFGVNEGGEEVSPLSLLEDNDSEKTAETDDKGEEGKEGEDKKESDDEESATDIKESYILKRLLEELDEIADEIDATTGDELENDVDEVGDDVEGDDLDLEDDLDDEI